MATKSLSELLQNVTRFGKLTVIREAPAAQRSNGALDRRALCICDCGTERAVYVAHLKRGNSKSCGCEIKRGKPTHGQFYHPLYSRWNAMLQRCTNPNHKDYVSYGAQGVSVCDRWKTDPAAFFEDMGPCPEGWSIDRIDPKGNYEPGNCRWADDITQAQNKRRLRLYEFRGEEICLTEVCRRAGIEHRFFAVHKRIRKGGSLAFALGKEGVVI